MKLDFSQILLALAAYMAAGSSLQQAGTPRAIWVGKVIETDATDPYTTLRIYGGEIPWTPQAVLQVQVKTTAVDPVAGMAQSAALFATMTDSDGRPLRMTTILARVGGTPGIRLNGVDPQQPPSYVGLDPNGRGRSEFVFNLKLRAVAI